MGITSLFKLLYLLFGRCGLFTAFSLYDFTQLAAVGSNQILFQRAGFEFHHNIVVIGRNQTVTSFKESKDKLSVQKMCSSYEKYTRRYE